MKQNHYGAIEEILLTYKSTIEDLIQARSPQFGKSTELKRACEYALLNGGKRFRPAIVLMIAKALNQNLPVGDAALAVEFFHTASLIADDLPCMDNDDMRRNRPSLHKAFGEPIALLASYALISEGYKAIYDNAEALRSTAHPLSKQSDRICSIALQNATTNTGIHGATGGQFLDLFPPDASLETLLETLNKKTVTLFEIAFVLGWVFGGGHPDLLPAVKKAAFYWGMAFQIADDLGDVKQDQLNNRPVNLATSIGSANALNAFHEQVSHLQSHLKELKLDSSDLQNMIEALILAAENANS